MNPRGSQIRDEKEDGWESDGGDWLGSKEAIIRWNLPSFLFIPI